MKVNVVDGRQLRAGRVILGMNMDELAKVAGISRNSVSRVENLKTLPLHAWAADRMAEALQERGVIFTVDNDEIGAAFSAPNKRVRKYPW